MTSFEHLLVATFKLQDQTQILSCEIRITTVDSTGFSDDGMSMTVDTRH